MCKYFVITLRQAQGERAFPFVVSLSNHELWFLTHPLSVPILP